MREGCGEAGPLVARGEGEEASKNVILGGGDALQVGGDRGVKCEGHPGEGGAGIAHAIDGCWGAAADRAGGGRRRGGWGRAGPSMHLHGGGEVVEADWDDPGEGEVGDAAGGEGHVADVIVSGATERDGLLQSRLWRAGHRDIDALCGLDGGVEDGSTRHAADVPAVERDGGVELGRGERVGEAGIAPA